MDVPIAKTILSDNEILSVLEPLKNGWLVQGPKVAEFEQKWCDFVGVKHSIAVTSCTSALHISLVALGFSPGDEAIVPAFTWISTANVIEHLGGKVVFADVDLNTFNLDVKKIESLITKKTKVIMPVHLFGLSADMDKIMALSKKYNLSVVEDAACGFGSYFKNRHVGSFGDAGCFSFHPRKSITTGEGGMITTSNDELAEKLRVLRNHGASLTDLQRHLGPRPYLLSDHIYPGFNIRMTDIQAALGSEQLKRGKEILSERIALADKYNQAFESLKMLNIPSQKVNYSNGYQSYPCLFQPIMVKKALKEKRYEILDEVKTLRNNLMDKLQQKGISTRPATHAVHMLSFFKEKYKLLPESYPVSFAANNCTISLPLFNGMSKDEQDYVIQNILQELR